MADALIPLYSTLLTSTTASISIGGFSSSYRDLRLVITGALTAGSSGAVMAQFNGDTAYTNYSRSFMYGNGSTATAGNDTTASSAGFIEMDTVQGVGILDILDYSASDKHKPLLSRGNSINTLVIAEAGRWASTSPITSILLKPYSGSFASGMTFSLFAIVG